MIIESKFVHPKEVFEVNFKSRVQVIEVGHEKHPVVMVDDFYKNPQGVRNFFLDSPVPIWKEGSRSRNFKDYYDCRQSIDLPFGAGSLLEVLRETTHDVFGLKVDFPPKAVSNFFQLIKSQPKDTTAFPHTDASPERALHIPVNALVYLNTNKEARGGTALYRHKKTGRESIPMGKVSYSRFHDEHIQAPGAGKTGETFWCYYKKFWEPFHLIPMKFNRLIIFPSQVFHGAWHEPTWFKEYPRIVQVFFSKFP